MPHPVKGNKQTAKSLIRQEVSRRGFMKMAGAAGALVGMAKWTPRALGQATTTVPSLALTSPRFDVTSEEAIGALLAYDPTKDPSAKYLRSQVPVAARISGFAATQAHPLLSNKPLLCNIAPQYASTDVDPAVNADLRYGNGYAYTPRFNQYQDLLFSLRSNGDLPDPGYTDAMHRNGALCLGWLVFNTTPFDTLLQQRTNGSFPVADKYVELAQYFGYDGYFINAETSMSQPQVILLAKFLKYMQAQAKAKGMTNFYIQFYDSVNFFSGSLDYEEQIDSNNSGWITSGAANSIFLDYGGINNVAPTSEYCKQIGLDPFKSTFYGLNTQGNFGAESSYAPQVIPVNGSGPAAGSLGLFFGPDKIVEIARLASLASVVTPPSDWFNIPTTGPGSQEEFFNTLTSAQKQQYQVAFVKEVGLIDRQFWSGWTQNPANSNDAPANGTPLYFTANVPEQSNDSYTYGLNVPPYGVANFITERSVIGSFPFLCRFNTGSGTLFFNKGKTVGKNPWYNIGVQDILPTWQWWTKDFNSSAIPSGLLTADYDVTTAYNGGSSLKVSGKLGPKNPTELRLFKTKLLVPSGGGPYVSLRYKAGQSGATNLYVGLIFEDNASAPVWTGVDAGFNVGATTNGWTQATLPLGNYAGRTIAAISLGFKAGSAVTAASSYAINIGEVALSNAASDAATVANPTGLAIERKLILNKASAQVRLTWNYDPAVWYYDIYRKPLQPNPNPTPAEIATFSDPSYMLWQGRISGDCYYISDLPRLGDADIQTAIQLVAVTPAGKEVVSMFATVAFPWTTNLGTPSFSLATSVTSPTFATGTSTTVPFTITEYNGFDSPVTLKASGLPAGITAKFSPNPATGTSAVLTLTASKTVVAGTYTVTVIGTSGSLTSTVALSVSVGAPSFSLSDTAGGYVYLPQEWTSADAIIINSVYGFNSNVALSVSGLPPGVTASFNPPSTKTSSTLTLTSSSAYTEPGATITITGTSGSLTQTINVYLG